MMKAASSALPAFTGGLAFLGRRRARPRPSVPKPPRITLKIERFMPLHMM
jgi:hypothetical protein